MDEVDVQWILSDMEISPVEGSPPINELDNPWTSIKALQCLYFLVYLWHSSHRLEYDAFRHSQFAIGWAEAFIDTAKEPLPIPWRKTMVSKTISPLIGISDMSVFERGIPSLCTIQFRCARWMDSLSGPSVSNRTVNCISRSSMRVLG